MEPDVEIDEQFCAAASSVETRMSTFDPLVAETEELAMVLLLLASLPVASWVAPMADAPTRNDC